MELYAVLDALTHIAPCKGGRWPSFWALLHGEAQGWKRIIARNKQMATVRVPLRECEYILVSLAPLQLSSATQKNKTDTYVRSFQSCRGDAD